MLSAIFHAFKARAERMVADKFVLLTDSLIKASEIIDQTEEE